MTFFWFNLIFLPVYFAFGWWAGRKVPSLTGKLALVFFGCPALLAIVFAAWWFLCPKPE